MISKKRGCSFVCFGISEIRKTPSYFLRDVYAEMRVRRRDCFFWLAKKITLVFAPVQKGFSFQLIAVHGEKSIRKHWKIRGQMTTIAKGNKVSEQDYNTPIDDCFPTASFFAAAAALLPSSSSHSVCFSLRHFVILVSVNVACNFPLAASSLSLLSLSKVFHAKLCASLGRLVVGWTSAAAEEGRQIVVEQYSTECFIDRK